MIAAFRGGWTQRAYGNYAMEQIPTATIPGDWPLPLMLDETWLRARRSLVHTLESAGLWPDTASHKAFMSAQHSIGSRLGSTLLLDVLGASDYARLKSELIFGSSNRRFQQRLPFVLAFGYELGEGFYHLLAADEGNGASDVGEACAVFNLGVSVFDLISDTDPRMFAEVATVFDTHTLDRTLQDPAQITHLLDAAEGMAVTEVRILLKLIAAFFLRLQTLGDAGDPRLHHIQRRLDQSLLAAHGAELRSTSNGNPADNEWVSISEAKSTLPFAILGDLAQLSACPSEATARSFQCLVRHVQALFWLTDDTADIVSDFQDGALNMLLAQCGAGVDRQRNPARDYPVMARLLASNLIEETVDLICEHLRAVEQMLSTVDAHPKENPRFCAFLRSYIRDWIE
jgi:hypothetical protein